MNTETNEGPTITTYHYPEIGKITSADVVDGARIQIGTELFRLGDNPEIQQILNESKKV